MIDIVRSQPPPSSLAEKKRYDGEDVLEALHRDFFGKCYLCETAIEFVVEQQVDHRVPWAHESLRFEWSNLYPTCNRWLCNQRRAKGYPEGGLLSPGDGVERRIVQRLADLSSRLAAVGTGCVFAAVDSSDVPATNTAIELDRIHNGTGSSPSHHGRLRAMTLRQAIGLQIARTADLLRALEEAPPASADRRAVLREDLRQLLSRRAPYTMLVRSCFAHLPEVRDLLD